MRDSQNRERRQRLKRRTALRLNDRVKIRHFSCNVKRGDLTRAVEVLAEATGDPLNDDARVVNHLAKAHKVAVRMHLCRVRRQVQYRLLLSLGKHRTTGEPVEKSPKIMLRLRHHAVVPVSASGSTWNLSATEASERLIGDKSTIAWISSLFHIDCDRLPKQCRRHVATGLILTRLSAAGDLPPQAARPQRNGEYELRKSLRMVWPEGLRHGRNLRASSDFVHS